MSTSLTYPVVLEPDDNDTVLATLPDFPGATYGATRAEALAHAQDLLVTAIESYMARRQPLPIPSEGGDGRIALPPSAALKVAVYRAMIERGIKKVELATRMGQTKQQIDRLLRLRYRSRADQIDGAFAALDLTLAAVDVTTSPQRRRLTRSVVAPSVIAPRRSRTSA